MATFTYTISTETIQTEPRELEVESFDIAKDKIKELIEALYGFDTSEFDFELDEETNEISATRRAKVGDKGAEYVLNIETMSGLRTFDVDVESDELAKEKAVAMIENVLDLKAADFDIEVVQGKVNAVKKIAVGDKGIA